MAQMPGNRVLYYLQNESFNRAFVREGLMHISEDTRVGKQVEVNYILTEDLL